VGDRLRIVVIGLPELGHLLEDDKPAGAEVVTIAAGPDVDRQLAERARGATRDSVLFVIAAGGEPAVDRLPARLARGDFRAVVLTGLPGTSSTPGSVPEHVNLAEVAAPFTADDVLDALTRLPGDVPFFLPVDGGDRVFGGDGLPVSQPPPGPTLDEWLAGEDEHEDGHDDPAAEPAAAEPVAAGRWSWATATASGAPTDEDDDDPLGPLVDPVPVARLVPPVDPDPLRVSAAVGAVALDAGPRVDAPAADPDLPRWAHLPPPAPPPPPVDRPVPWADAGWPVPPVIPGAALPSVGPGEVPRRGTVISVCSYKGGSGKCLTGDSLIVDPVTGVPHRLDEVVRAPELVTVLTLDDTTIRCTPISAKIDSGTKPTLRIDLRSGRRVTVTPHHPFLLADGWRPASAIAVGEAVAVPARTPFPLRPRPLDGPALVAVATEIAAGPAAMPDAAYRLPADQLARLLAMLWSYLGRTGADGEALAELPSEALARAVQHLLTRFAVPTRIGPATPDPQGRWQLTVAAADVPALRSRVILADPDDPGPDPGRRPDDRGWDEVVTITPAGDRRVWDLTVEPTHCFVANDVVVHNTTTALMAAGTLARALRPAGKRVALVDANTAQSSIGTILQRPPRGSVLDLVRTDVDERLLATALTPVPEAGGLDVLVGAPDLRSTARRLVTTSLYRRIVATLRRTHDYVIVDTPVAEAVDHELFDDFVLRDSDMLVVVLDPNRETIHNNVEWLDIIGDPVSAGGRNVLPERIGVVLNRADPDQAWNTRTVGDHFRRYHFLGAIPDSPAVQRAANEARLLDRFDPGVERAVRSVLATLVDEPLVAPDADPAAGSPVARLVALVRATARRG
jgi:MinD-like ATPase involved in chromosome partitioning or flagellar assembly